MNLMGCNPEEPLFYYFTLQNQLNHVLNGLGRLGERARATAFFGFSRWVSPSSERPCFPKEAVKGSGRGSWPSVQITRTGSAR